MPFSKYIVHHAVSDEGWCLHSSTFKITIFSLFAVSRFHSSL